MKTCIVLMWCENTGFRKTGKLVLRDANWFEQVESAPQGCACVFSRRLNEMDRALAYAAEMRRADPDKYGVRVVEMEDTEDLLTRARKMALDYATAKA